MAPMLFRSAPVAFLLLLTTLLFTCRRQADEYATGGLFERVPPDSSGVQFSNDIQTSDSVNIVAYEYLYNGGGVGIGDFNNDGKPDLFLTGNQVPCRLYINEGGFRFRDVTPTAGIDAKGWAFGVTVADVNQDGWADVYVSVAGIGNKKTFPNRLFINQHDLTFQEMAVEYGLDSPTQSIQAAFFDYDRDGDLDMYQLVGGGFDRSPVVVRPIINDGTASNTDRLLRNEFDAKLGHPVFRDVSKRAGIQSEGYGLGLSVLDVNEDGWPDLYVTNDYQSNDHLYVNNQNGTFTDQAARYFKHTSHFAMGNDVGDINNDGLMDIVATDMLPDDHFRRKLMFGPNQYDKFTASLRQGYLPQYMRNTLQLNNGRGFSEIGQLAGVYKTDWSWSVLFADLDNDEYQDIFITNGFGKDVTDLDFVKFRNQTLQENPDKQARLRTMLDSLAVRPGLKMANVAFQNMGNCTFENSTKAWGFDRPVYSNGAAYADLDGDGDLDMVINNTDEKASIYRNTLREKNPATTNYLRISLVGPKTNPTGIGSHVTMAYAGKQQVRYQSPTRGFMSSTDPVLHLGLGKHQRVDTVRVQWPDGRESRVMGIAANQLLLVDYQSSTPKKAVPAPPVRPLMEPIPVPFAYRHTENDFADFKYEPLLPHKYSQNGPGLAVGDINGDGSDDFYVGGGFQQPGRVFLQRPSGTFAQHALNTTDATGEDMGCLLFDADGDGDNDLYVANGGNEYSASHAGYRHRLYLNDGRGNFSDKPAALPDIRSSGSCVVAGDYDRDGDLDLFVGGRVVPGAYPTTPPSYLLRNDRGTFTDVTDAVAPGLRTIGMVTSALWTDPNNDHQPDLLVVGEWIPITLFSNKNGKLTDQTAPAKLARSEGWWNSVVAGDFDNDGDLDYVVGNLGLNSHYRATPTEPLRVYHNDYNKNGTVKPILAYYENGTNYPEASLDGLTEQLPYLKKKLLYYKTYAMTTIEQLLNMDGMAGSEILECRMLASSYVENLGDGTFAIRPLPMEAQVAPLFGMIADDIDNDGWLDLLAVGNSYAPEVVYGRMDALAGLTLLGTSGVGFRALPVRQSGLFVNGDAKGFVKLRTARGWQLLATQNSDSLRTFQAMKSTTAINPKPGEWTAILRLKNGQQRRVELSYGSSYLSQSSRVVSVPPGVRSVQFFDSRGRQTRDVLAAQFRP